MLSKLHATSHNKTAYLNEFSSLIRCAFSGNCTVTPLENTGTLGLCYALQNGSESLFVKTHLPGDELRRMLIKEAVLLQKLYGDDVVREVISVDTEKGIHTLLVMQNLRPLSSAPSPQQVDKLIEEYSHVFASFSDAEWQLLSPSMPDFSQVLESANNALEFLSKENQLDDTVLHHCAHLLKTLQNIDDERVLCHGDFSNKNIMQKNGSLYVIDWEDAFFGVPDYDFYYWLTFFDQRVLYNKDAFAKFSHRNPIGVAMMIAIVLVKSQMAFESGAYKNHSLSANDRLSEILALEAL